jgi:hypothetical protein
MEPARPAPDVAPVPEPPTGLSEVPLRPPGLIARLLGRKPRDNAFLEIRNLIATRAIRDLDPDEVARVLASYGIEPEEAQPQLRKIYALVLRNVIRDNLVTDEELEELSHLRHVLGFSDADVRDIERELLEDAYRTQTRLAVGDSLLTEDEKVRLHDLAARLRIPEETAKAIRAEEVAIVFDRVFNATIVDRRLSEEEEALLRDLAANLGVTMDHDQATLRQLDRFRLLWRIEQGEMHPLETTLSLAPHEQVYFRAPAKRHEAALARPAAEPGKRVRLGKSVYWRLDEGALEGERATEWTAAGEGTLSITNLRLVYESGGESSELRHEDMIRFTVFRDALQPELDNGLDLLFTIAGDAEIAGTILGVFVKATRG